MKTFSLEISLSLLILFLISQQLLFYYLFCYKILTKQVTAMKTKLILSFLLIIFSITACNTTEPPPPPDGEKPTLALALDDASCTEAWLQLTTKDLELPAELTLKQYNPTGDSLSQDFILNTQDSLLYIDSLLPSQSYQYQVSSNEHQVSSNELNVTTMDTTSHDFTFETFTFGTIGSSVLYDVAIIDENNIWAVGEILVADTSINGYTMYNAVHWDGNEWELISIPFLFQGDSFYNPIYAVFAFNADDIWFGIGNLIHWDGTRYFPVGISSVFQSLVNKIWGSSSSDLYVVGNNGKIAHYNGTRWSRIESGTDLHISDIWGQKKVNGNYEILCVASDYSQWLGTKVLEITDNNVLEINDEGLPQSSLYAVWFIPERSYFVSGDGFYSVKKLGERWIKDVTMPPYSKTGIRGDGLNDIVVSGAYGLLMHFNGLSWKTFFNMPYLSGSYGEVKIKGDIIVSTGGLNNGQAIITIGRR